MIARASGGALTHCARIAGRGAASGSGGCTASRSLNMPLQAKRRILKRESVSLAAGSLINQGWDLNFMRDVRQLHTFKMIDDANRETLAIKEARSRPASTLLRAVDRSGGRCCAPLSIRMSNNPAMTSPDFVEWGPVLRHCPEPHRACPPHLLSKVPNGCLFKLIERVQTTDDDQPTQRNEYRPHAPWIARHPGRSVRD